MKHVEAARTTHISFLCQSVRLLSLVLRAVESRCTRRCERQSSQTGSIVVAALEEMGFKGKGSSRVVEESVRRSARPLLHLLVCLPAITHQNLHLLVQSIVYDEVVCHLDPVWLGLAGR